MLWSFISRSRLDGNWFCRQLNGDSEGTIHDLDVVVQNNELKIDNNVEAITWGDCHFARIDPNIAKLAWGRNGISDYLRPNYQFLHDVLDFQSRNHHDRNNPFKYYELYRKGVESVKQEVENTFKSICDIYKDNNWSTFFIVDSNHDRALERWLRESDWKSDPINMEFYMEAALSKIKAIKNDDKFHMLDHWWGKIIDDEDIPVVFLDEDESFIICPDKNGGIECGMHGHLGPNGSRGGIRSLARMGRKANIGHSHTACIMDGVYQAGTSSLLDLGYNSGPSSWSHSAVITYKNGKRCVITMWNNKWRA